jgi:hypothetical protein
MIVSRRRRLFGQTPGLATDLSQLAKTQIAGGRFAEARMSLAEARPMAMRFLGERSIPVIMLDLAEAQTLAELGDAKGAETALNRARPSLAKMPPANPLAPQLALTEAVVAVKKGRQAGGAGGRRARDRGLHRDGPGRHLWSAGDQAKIDARVRAMR